MYLKMLSTKWRPFCFGLSVLTHWGQVTHICVGNLTITGSDNGLSPGRRQAIIWTSAGILSIGPKGTNFSEILIGNKTFLFKKMHLKMSSAKRRPFCFGLRVLRCVSWWAANWARGLFYSCHIKNFHPRFTSKWINKQLHKLCTAITIFLS